MKFLIVAPRFHTNLYYRVKSLQNEGHMVVVVVLYKGKSEFYEDIAVKQIELSQLTKIFIKTISLFKKNKLKSSLELRTQAPNYKLRKTIKSYKPDVIILKAYQNMLAIKTLILAKRFKVKVLMLTQTEFTHIKNSKFLFKLNIKLFKFLKVFAYITPIKSNFDKFKAFGIENIYYIPFVFPTTESKKFKPNSHLNTIEQEQHIKIISIGKFVKRKDQILLIKSIHKLLKQNYKIELNLYGEKADKNYFNEINSYIKNNKLQKNINIFTNIPYKTLLEEYKEHDIFVLPSYSEPAAYSPVEAMSNGLPVICSDQNGTKCYIEDGANGFIFKSKNLNDLTEKIKLLISDNNRLKLFSKNSLYLVAQNHKLKNFESQIIELLAIK